MNILGGTVFNDPDVPTELHPHTFITVQIPYSIEVLTECLNTVPGIIVTSMGTSGFIITMSLTQVLQIVRSTCVREKIQSVRRFGNDLYDALPKLKNLLNTSRRALGDGTFILQQSR